MLEAGRRGPERAGTPGPTLEAAGRCGLEDVQHRLCGEPPGEDYMKAWEALACKLVPWLEEEHCKSALEAVCSLAEGSCQSE